MNNVKDEPQARTSLLSLVGWRTSHQQNRVSRIGLSQPEVLNQALRVSDYITVLKHLWAEQNDQKRLTWLREKHKEFHVPLIYELSLEEFKAKPTLDTIQDVVLPLFVEALFRTELDLVCSRENLNSYAESFRAMYVIHFTNSVFRLAPSIEPNILSNLPYTERVTVKSKEKTCGMAIWLCIIGFRVLPNPVWVTKLYDHQTSTLYPVDEHDQCRLRVLKKELTKHSFAKTPSTK